MVLGIECLLLCLVMWLLCFLGVGGDKKNIKYYESYPDVIKEKLKNDPKYKDQIKTSNPIIKFISNFFTYLIIIFLLGIGFRTSDFLYNFVGTLILGQVLNLFDLLIIDLCWWRHSKKIRFTEYPDKELYLSPKTHIIAFVKALIMFTMIAAVSGGILTLF